MIRGGYNAGLSFLYFSLYRQREVSKRELVARFESEQITILKNCAAGLASLKQVLAPPTATCSFTAFYSYPSRYRNQRSWLARCNVAEGGGNNKERDVTLFFIHLLLSNFAPPSFPPHRHGAGCSILIGTDSPAIATILV